MVLTHASCVVDIAGFNEIRKILSYKNLFISDFMFSSVIIHAC